MMSNKFLRYLGVVIAVCLVLFGAVPWLLSQANDVAVMIGVLLGVLALYGVWRFIESECEKIPDFDTAKMTNEPTETNKNTEPTEPTKETPKEKENTNATTQAKTSP